MAHLPGCAASQTNNTYRIRDSELPEFRNEKGAKGASA
jgi:hypothetical protein